MPQLASGDVVVAFDDLAAAGLGRPIIRFDDLQTWEDRSAGERRVTQAFRQARDSPALRSLSLGDCQLADFFEHSLRVELAHVVRGWVAARAAPGCTMVVADPACPTALVLGAHAALGLEPPECPYAPDQDPTWQSSLPRRIVGNTLVRAAARTARSTDARIAITANYKVTPALAALNADQLHRRRVAAMPLPGFDPRDNLRTAAHTRLPILRTLAPVSQRGCPPLGRTGDIAISTGEADLDSAFSDVTRRLAQTAWPQMWQAVEATEALGRQRNLRALLLPTLFSGTPRVFTAWARANGIRIGVLQHGLYAYRRFDGQDRGADVLLTWGDAVADQARDWDPDGPPAKPRTVGAPGVQQAHRAAPPLRVRRVLFATTGPNLESVIFPTAIHDSFLSAVLPGVAQMQRQGIETSLRVHPSETPARYARALEIAQTAMPFSDPMPIADALEQHDLLVCAFSSVALEASALGLPVLMWLPSMPASFASEHLVAPWTRALPGIFRDQADFLALVDGITGENPPAVAEGLELAGALREYARPFSAVAFSSALDELTA